MNDDDNNQQPPPLSGQGNNPKNYVGATLIMATWFDLGYLKKMKKEQKILQEIGKSTFLCDLHIDQEEEEMSMVTTNTPTTEKRTMRIFELVRLFGLQAVISSIHVWRGSQENQINKVAKQREWEDVFLQLEQTNDREFLELYLNPIAAGSGAAAATTSTITTTNVLGLASRVGGNTAVAASVDDSVSWQSQSQQEPQPTNTHLESAFAVGGATINTANTLSANLMTRPPKETQVTVKEAELLQQTICFQNLISSDQNFQKDLKEKVKRHPSSVNTAEAQQQMPTMTDQTSGSGHFVAAAGTGADSEIELLETTVPSNRGRNKNIKNWDLNSSKTPAKDSFKRIGTPMKGGGIGSILVQDKSGKVIEEEKIPLENMQAASSHGKSASAIGPTFNTANSISSLAPSRQGATFPREGALTSTGAKGVTFLESTIHAFATGDKSHQQLQSILSKSPQRKSSGLATEANVKSFGNPVAAERSNRESSSKKYSSTEQQNINTVEDLELKSQWLQQQQQQIRQTQQMPSPSVPLKVGKHSTVGKAEDIPATTEGSGFGVSHSYIHQVPPSIQSGKQLHTQTKNFVASTAAGAGGHSVSRTSMARERNNKTAKVAVIAAATPNAAAGDLVTDSSTYDSEPTPAKGVGEGINFKTTTLGTKKAAVGKVAPVSNSRVQQFQDDDRDGDDYDDENINDEEDEAVGYDEQEEEDQEDQEDQAIGDQYQVENIPGASNKNISKIRTIKPPTRQNFVSSVEYLNKKAQEDRQQQKMQQQISMMGGSLRSRSNSGGTRSEDNEPNSYWRPAYYSFEQIVPFDLDEMDLGELFQIFYSSIDVDFMQAQILKDEGQVGSFLKLENLEEIMVKQLVTGGGVNKIYPVPFLTFFPYYEDKQRQYPNQDDLFNVKKDVRIQKNFKQIVGQSGWSELNIADKEILKTANVDDELNTNLKDLMMAVNCQLGFNLFNCPKTFIAFISYSTGFSFYKTLKFLSKGTFSFNKNAYFHEIIPYVTFNEETSQYEWSGSELKTFKYEKKVENDQPLNAIIGKIRGADENWLFKENNIAEGESGGEGDDAQQERQVRVSRMFIEIAYPKEWLRGTSSSKRTCASTGSEKLIRSHIVVKTLHTPRQVMYHSAYNIPIAGTKGFQLDMQKLILCQHPNHSPELLEKPREMNISSQKFDFELRNQNKLAIIWVCFASYYQDYETAQMDFLRLILSKIGDDNCKYSFQHFQCLNQQLGTEFPDNPQQYYLAVMRRKKAFTDIVLKEEASQVINE